MFSLANIRAAINMLRLPRVLFVFHLSNLVDKNIRKLPKHVAFVIDLEKPQLLNALSIVPARAVSPHFEGFYIWPKTSM